MPTSRGLIVAAAAVALLVAGAVGGVEEFVLLAVALAVVEVGGAAYVALRRGAVRGSLQLRARPSRAEAVGSDGAAVVVSVANEGRRSLTSLVMEDPRRCWRLAHPGMSGGPPRARSPAEGHAPAGPPPRGGGIPVRVAAGEAWSESLPLPQGSRGLATWVGARLWLADPFGVFALPVAAFPAARILVCPSPRVLPGGAIGAMTVAGEGSARPRPPFGEGAHVDLRPYAPGDSLRRLHWPSLARTGELLVRELVDTPTRRLTVLVDLRPSAHRASSVESTLATAAGLAVAALESGMQVVVRTSSGDGVRVPAGPRAQRSLLRALALVDAEARHEAGAGPQAGPWHRELAESRRGRAQVVVVTTPVGAADAVPADLAHRVRTVLDG